MPREKKLRTVIMHDPELDDLNTVIRYLLYSNQFETEGLIYSSSRFHWKGDGKGTLFQGESEHSKHGIGPITKWRWDEGSCFIEDAVKAYAEAYPRLSIHADGYPHPEELRSKICNGNVEFPGDITLDSPGSELIKKLILDGKPGKLYLLTGAGQSTIGRALKSIEEEFKGGSDWNEIYDKINQKVIIQSFGDQDGVYQSYIAPNWPKIEFREMATMIWGYMARRSVQPEDRHYLSAAWTRENVSKIGPFGELYMVWGDGKQMHQNDIADFFGFAGLTVEQLKALGYIPWYGALEDPGSWISEGDTSMYMNLIDNGLEAHIDASYGGWGGRNGKDINPSGIASKDYSSSRWFGAAQRDFAARLQWTVATEYNTANHAPVIQILDPKDTKVVPGQIITLTAKVKDPDGDNLTARWWQYEEAGSYPGKVELRFVGELQEKQPMRIYPFVVPAPSSLDIVSLIKDEITVTCQFTVPADAVNGQTFHFIAEASDFARYSMTAYQRVVLTVIREE